MKIMLVTPYFYPKIGGLENYAYNFACALKKQFKCEVVIVTSNHIKKKDEVLYIDGMKVYRLAALCKVSNTPIHPLWYWKIKKIIKKEKPQIINPHTPVPFIADMAALAAGKIPVVVTYHAFNLYKHTKTVFNLVIKGYTFFENVLFNRADKILIVSSVCKENIPHKYRKKILVINNSLSKHAIPSLKKTHNKNILFISNLDKTHAWKGLHEILRAIKIYKQLNKNTIKLYVIGDGDSMKNYQSLVKQYGLTKQVLFVGKKTGKEKKKILRNASMGIIYPQSSNDAFPTVALEYWAYSIAIVASDIMPVNKIIKNKITGYLVPTKNPIKLAQTISFLVDNPAITNKLSQNGYTELLNNYILENEVNKFYSVIKAI